MRGGSALESRAKSTFVIMVSGEVGMTVTQSEAPGESSVLAASSHLLQPSAMPSLINWVRLALTSLVRFLCFSFFKASSGVFLW